MKMIMFARKSTVSLSAVVALALLLNLTIFGSVSATAGATGAEVLRSELPRPLPPEVVDEKIAALQRAESAGTVFLLGLIFGMVSGVALFFLYLRRQQNKHARRDSSDYLFDDWPNRPARGLRGGSFGSGRQNKQLPPPNTTAGDFPSEDSDEMIEQPEPWERSVDWWKGEPEE